MRYEILDEQGAVENIIEADADFMAAQYPEGNYREAAVQIEPVVPVILRHITQLAFLNRLTDAEAIALDLASIGATVEAASMRRYLAKVQAAKWIDLDMSDTRAGVQALEAFGLLAPGRAAQILDAPIQAGELP